MTNYYTQQTLPTDEAAAALGFGAVAAILIMYLVLFAYAVFNYIMTSYSLYTIAKRRGIDNPWLAWLPIGNSWNLGAITREYDEHNGIKRRWDKVLLILNIAGIACAVFFMIAAVLFIIFAVANQENSNIDGAVMGASVVSGVLFLAAYVALIVCAVVSSVISTLCIYKVFESTVPEKSLKYFLLSLLCPFAAPICLFLCRNKGYGVEQYYYQSAPIEIAPNTQSAVTASCKTAEDSDQPDPQENSTEE